MASLLESYEQQYGNITSEITHKIGLISKSKGDEKRTHCLNVDRLFDETNELLEQMGLEIHDLPLGVRQKYSNRLTSYKTELEKLQMDYRRARSSYYDESAVRDELLGMDGQYGVSEDQRMRLLDNTERLERGTKRLESSYRTTAETEAMGAQILEDLNHQRETLQKSRDRLRDVNEGLGKSSRILTSMARRIVQNRIVLILVVAIMIVIIGVTIYLVTRKSTPDHRAPETPEPKPTSKH